MQEMSIETQNKQRTAIKSSGDVVIVAGAGADSDGPEAC
jgi:hypothetical protein